MTSNQAAQSAVRTLPSKSYELKFAGDGVLLAGQIDYPDEPRPARGYPLVFILHHAGCNTRIYHASYADMALEVGYAVFRWDKRGTGRSGSGGRGSVTQDAVNAYTVALEQPNIDRNRVIILAQGGGTGMLGASYGLFARKQPPYGVILVSSLLDETAILAIETRVHIVMSDKDFNPWTKYAEAAAAAHNAAYRYGASYYVARHADREMIDWLDNLPAFHPGARKVIQDWLSSAHPASRFA